MSNDYGTPWAYLWAGFQFKSQPTSAWVTKLFDEVSWTWTTDSGTGWVKLIGDAEYSKIILHAEWLLGDDDTLLSITWRTTNTWKDLAEVRLLVRNGQIKVNGDGTDNWYRAYKTDGTIVDGQLPADASYTQSADSLTDRYKLIGNSKDIDWRIGAQYVKDGTSYDADYVLNVVDTNSKYGANGYVQHSVSVGAVDKNSWAEWSFSWHDAETDYLASLRLFEMSGGTNRNYTSASGNTVDADHWFGYEESNNNWGWTALSTQDQKIAIKLQGIASVDKVLLRMNGSSFNGTLTVGLQGDSGGSPDGSWIDSATASYVDSDVPDATGWAEKTLSATATPTNRTDIVWLVVHLSSLSSGSVSFVRTDAPVGEDVTTVNCLGEKIYSGGSWGSLSNRLISSFLLYGKSDMGYVGPTNRYTLNQSIFKTLSSDYYPQIKNDQSTLYRTVFQIKPLDDAWKATRDADNEAYFDNDTGGTAWGGWETAGDSTKWFIDDGAGPASAGFNIFVTDAKSGGQQDAEWNGTDTNISQVTTDEPPESSGGVDTTDDRIECYHASNPNNWEDHSLSNLISQNNWGTWEFWFKVANDFTDNDTPEVKYFNTAGGGGVQLTGCRFTYLIEAVGPPPAAGQIIVVN